MIDGNEIEYYYQLITNEEKSPVSEVESLNDCNHNYVPIEGKYICNLCGIHHPNRIYFSEQAIYSKQKYKRKGYFREKLKLLIGKKQSLSEDYNVMLDKLKPEYKSKDINDLRKLIKQSYGKYSKYIHSIHYDLTGERLINLSDDDITKLEKKFYSFEKKFKELYPDSYYMLSYNIILHQLLKENNYNFYKYILLPKNYNKTKNKFCEILID